MAPAECNNVAIKDEKRNNYQLLFMQKRCILANVTLFRSKLVPSKNIMSSITSNAIEKDKAMINLIDNIFDGTKECT